MKKIFSVLLFAAGFWTATYAVGQVYDGKYDQAVSGIDRIAEEHAAVYANVAEPGEADELVPQEERYVNMTSELNALNEKVLDGDIE